MAIDIEHPGAHRRHTGAPSGGDVPASTADRDLDARSAKTRKRAQFVKNARKWRKGKHEHASRDQPEHTLVIKYDDEGSLEKLIRELHRLGNDGSSRSVVIEDDDGFRVGWDGDGADKIWSAEMDGESILPPRAEAARLVTVQELRARSQDVMRRTGKSAEQLLADHVVRQETASKFWDGLTPRERRAYLKAHPHSKYARSGAASGEASAIAKHLTSRGWVQAKTRGIAHWSHPVSRRKMVITPGEAHKHRIVVTHPNGDVHTRLTNSDRVLRRFTARMARKPKLPPGGGISGVLKSNKGSLHAHLGVPHGVPIPLGKLQKLANSDHPLAGRARLVLNLKRARKRGPVEYLPAK